ncbi:peptidase S24/S26A/S26B/S26C [Mrakia frigida]|uniref:endopeptidase catalytic subunit IMP1 n=1 Tax=Mrakia frigida TaxID=29902 RepID=UPI003FCC13B5
MSSSSYRLLSRLANLDIPYPIRAATKASVITVQVACLLHLLTDRIGFIQECKGESMLPTLAPEGDWIIYNRLPYFFPSSPTSSKLNPIHPFGRGDLVIAAHPFLPDRTVGKRIIAMGGDTVEVNPGNLRPPRSGLARAAAMQEGEWKVAGEEGERGGGAWGGGDYLRVPPGHVWLQGDNLSNSTDSRDYGPVPLALLLARVEGRVWPTQTRFRNTLRWLSDI